MAKDHGSSVKNDTKYEGKSQKRAAGREGGKKSGGGS